MVKPFRVIGYEASSEEDEVAGAAEKILAEIANLRGDVSAMSEDVTTLKEWKTHQDRQLFRLEETVKASIGDFRHKQDVMDNRLRTVENWIWKFMGAAAVVVAVANYFLGRGGG